MDKAVGISTFRHFSMPCALAACRFDLGTEKILQYPHFRHRTLPRAGFIDRVCEPPVQMQAQTSRSDSPIQFERKLPRGQPLGAGYEVKKYRTGR